MKRVVIKVDKEWIGVFRSKRETAPTLILDATTGMPTELTAGQAVRLARGLLRAAYEINSRRARRAKA